MDMIIIRKISVLIVFVVIEIFFASTGYCQKNEIIRVDTVGDCAIFLTNKPYDYTQVKVVDSLIKSYNDTVILKIYTHVGNNTTNDYCNGLYKKNGFWTIIYKGNIESVDFKSPLNFGNHKQKEGSFVTALCPNMLNKEEIGHYRYFLLINNKVLQSLDADIPASVAITVDRNLENEIILFKNFDDLIEKITKQ